MNKKFEVGQLIRQKITGFIAQIIEISETGYHCDNAYVPFTAQDQWELVEEHFDLRKAACDYEYIMWENGHPEDTYTSSDIIKAFKAGANWQKQQTIKDAVETIIDSKPNDYGEFIPIIHVKLDSSYKDGEKVRVIIIKKE